MSFGKKQQEPFPFHLYDEQQSDKLLKCKSIQNINDSYFIDLDKTSAKFKIQLRAYLSMYQKGRICYGTAQCGTQFQNLCYNACITLLLQASPAHMHLVARKNYKIKYTHPNPSVQVNNQHNRK